MSGYGSDAGFNTWLASWGYSLPIGAPTEAVLRQRGSMYIDGVYGGQFPGEPTGGLSQERAWPRTDAQDMYGNAIDPNTVPERVIEASYYAAFQEASAPGSLAASYTPGANKVLTQVNKIKWEIAGSGDTVSTGMATVYTAIEGLLLPLLTTSLDIPAILVV